MKTDGRRDVLIVEDDSDIAEVVAIILEEDGWSVRRVGDGEAAIDAIRERRPAVVVLDIGLPIMNGEDFMTLLRYFADVEKIRVVVITARTAIHEAELLDNGVETILRKPFDMHQFLAVVRGSDAA